MVSRDIIDISEFSEFSECREISAISEYVIGLGFVVSLSAYLTEGEQYTQCHIFVLHDIYGTLCKN